MEKEFFDSTVIIDFLRGNLKAAEYINKILHHNLPVLISTVTYAELLIGAKNKNDQIKLEKTLKPFNFIPINEEICNLAINLLKNFTLSYGILILDSFIAATALLNHYTLVTANIKHFQMIKGLKVKAWPRNQ